MKLGTYSVQSLFNFYPLSNNGILGSRTPFLILCFPFKSPCSETSHSQAKGPNVCEQFRLVFGTPYFLEKSVFPKMGGTGPFLAWFTTKMDNNE